MPSFKETARLVDEWYEGAKEWEASGGASSTEHLLLLLKVVLSCVSLKHFRKKGYTPLHALADTDKSKKMRCTDEKGMNMRGSVKLLQSFGLDIDSKGGDDAPLSGGRTPLHRAACEGHFDLVRGLVEAGADINANAKFEKRSALGFAAGGDHPLILGYLMRHGAEVEGSEALHQAAYVGSPENVEALLKAGGKPNEINTFDTAAQKCCMGGGEKKGGRVKALSLLLKSGANVKVKDVNGANLLHLAARYGNAQCIPVLLERGLQLDARNIFEVTPFHYACDSGSLACVKELMRLGVSLDLQDDLGRTPLFDAVVRGHVKIVSELIRAGASVKVKSTTAITPLHLAAALGNMELSYLLVEAEAEIDALTNTGQSPLMACMHPDEQALSQILGYYRTVPGSQEAREKVAAFLLKRSAAVDGKVVALAAEKGFGDVLASFISTKSNRMDALSDRFDTVAEHFAVTAEGDDERADEVVQVRLVNKATGERGGKQYTLSIPLVEQLMKKVRERGETGGEEATKSAGKASSAAGILPTLLDPAKYGYKSGRKGKGKDKKKEIELEYNGVNFTEEGFEAVMKFVTTGSVETLLTRRLGSAGNESSSGAEGGSSSSSSGGRVRKEHGKLFDEIRAKQALQAAEFFCLEGMSREVKALMDEYGFELQEETAGGGGGEGQPSRKRARTDP